MKGDNVYVLIILLGTPRVFKTNNVIIILLFFTGLIKTPIPSILVLLCR